MCVTSWRNVGIKAVSGAFSGATACGFTRFLGPVGWKAWGVCIVGGAAAGAVADIVEQCLALTTTTFNTCQNSYSYGADLFSCGGFLKYKLQQYGVNPYVLLDIPGISFP